MKNRAFPNDIAGEAPIVWKISMKIVYEDKDQIVIHKPAGVATQTARLGEKDLVSEVKNHIAKESGNSNPYVAVINRLDQPVEGIVLFAKNAKAAAALTSQMQDGSMQKFYYAVVAGHMDISEGQFIDYMQKDARSNVSRVVSQTTPNAKKAMLSYEVKANLEKMQFLQIQLLTGRHHQIRVQFSHRGHALIGDTKYGSAESISLGREMNARVPALCAFCLKWKHPVTKKELSVEIQPDNSLMRGVYNEAENFRD